ncbi:ribonuclease HII [Polymorphobacter sp.]|uniref:ribonuclease HII n=1 Tax=Polymorphobacter sp. TaxID=1909290 RepID=UPI003F6EEE89
MIVVGVDEAGRGPWAGPVVAAAVVLPGRGAPGGVTDSKLLSAARRRELAAAIRDCACVGVGEASVEEIETLNIHWATMLAMERAVAALGLCPDEVLVDGNRLPRWGWTSRAIVQGDFLVPAIGAASIIAKTVRDATMAGLDAECPGYGWGTNQGYGTPEHAAALARLGVSAHHRRGFAPVRARLAAC